MLRILQHFFITDMHAFIRSLRLFARHGNAGTKNICNRRRTNAVVEVSYECMRSLAICVSVVKLYCSF